MYMEENKYVEGSLTTCPFSKNSSRFPTTVFDLLAFDLHRHVVLTRVIAPGMDSLLWSRLQVQSESSWLPQNGHATIVAVNTLCLSSSNSLPSHGLLSFLPLIFIPNSTFLTQ